MKKIYALLLLTTVAYSSYAGICSTLFFSEYMKGSSNNKALEIYNPTGNAVNLNGYRVLLFPNGNTNPSVNFILNGTIAAGGVYVIMNSQADSVLKLLADTTSGVTAFTGNDAVVLIHGVDTIDVIGQVGVNPGAGWQVDTFSTGTSNHTLIRKPNVSLGTTNWSFSSSQWLVLPLDSNQLGSHAGPTGQTLCSTTAYDTLVSFSPVSGYFSGVNGSVNLDLALNSIHANALTIDVELISGNASWINNYTTQSISFSPNTVFKSVPVTITNDTTGQQTHVLTFRLTNAGVGLKIGADSIFTLTLTPFAALDTCGTIFFSEYVEGSSSNKALEIYNPTNNAIDLNGYKVQVFANGGTTGNSLNLTGILPVGGTYVIVNPQADSVVLKPLADTLSTNATGFNGNDAVALIHGADTIDVVGVVGVDPGSNGWTVGNGTTTNHTLVRKNVVQSGTKSWAVSATQWNVFGVDTQYLGAHTGPTNVSGCVLINSINNVETNNVARVYPNPNNGKFVIELNTVANVEMNLYDMTGRVVYSTQLNSTNIIKIDVNNLNSGIYIAEVKADNKVSRSRISVQY